MTQDQSRVVRQAELFHDLSTALLDEMLSVMRVSRFAPGSRLFSRGQAGRRLWVVLEGRVGVTAPRGDQLLAVMEAGDAIGEVQVFDPAPWAFSATAMTAAAAASASREEVLAWVGRNPPVSAHLLQLMARRLATKSRAAQEPLPSYGGGRVAREVLALADRYTVEGVVRHGLTQQQLADIVGLSRERVNKVLGDFCDRRWIAVRRGRFTILDRESLEEHAHHAPLGSVVGSASAKGTA